MGVSDGILYSPQGLYSKIQSTGATALLGFIDNKRFDGDCYDLRLGNWNINDDWQLDKKYDTIICLRCAYFAKDPEEFIKKCYESLNDNGRLYVDWGLGDHWRFDNFKVGWVKDGEHEHCYGEDNLLWSTIWDDSLLANTHVQNFEQTIKNNGYTCLKKAVQQEVPKILSFEFLEKYFDFTCDVFQLYGDAGAATKFQVTDFEKLLASEHTKVRTQLYVLMSGVKK